MPLLTPLCFDAPHFSLTIVLQLCFLQWLFCYEFSLLFFCNYSGLVNPGVQCKIAWLIRWWCALICIDGLGQSILFIKFDIMLAKPLNVLKASRETQHNSGIKYFCFSDSLLARLFAFSGSTDIDYFNKSGSCKLLRFHVVCSKRQGRVLFPVIWSATKSQRRF